MFILKIQDIINAWIEYLLYLQTIRFHIHKHSNTMSEYNEITREMKSLGSEEKRKVLQRFFKTGEGEYGYGDKFLGVTVPMTRNTAKKHRQASIGDIGRLLRSEWHEIRLCALLIMVFKMEKAGEKEQKELFDLYMRNTDRINNWDIVDLSAPKIAGLYLKGRDRTLLYELADSPSLWENRIAMVTTLAFIRAGELDDAFAIAFKMMTHRHDLMHKAAGWMLREAGKKDTERLRRFILDNYSAMPRTMLRYAIEKFPEDERKEILNLGKP